jgi:HEAT repeat protein
MLRALRIQWWLQRTRAANPGVREKACRQLGTAGDPAALEWLIARLRDSSPDVRKAACVALGQLRLPEALGPLLEQLEQPDRQLRAAARDALTAFGAAAAAPLLDRLGASHGPGRAAVCEALAILRDPRAVEPLIAQTEDADGNVREAACGALGALGDPRAVPALSLRLADADYGVRSAASNALTRLGEGRLAAAVLAVVDGKPDGPDLVEQLKAGGDPRAAGLLLAWLENAGGQSGVAVCGALARLGETRAVGPLIRWLAHERPQDRLAACDALGRLGDARAVGPLLGRLADPVGPVCAAARDAVVALGGASVQPAIDALAGAPPAKKWTLCQALGKLADARAVSPLLGCLADLEPRVRSAAGEALRELGEAPLAEAVLGVLEGQPEALGALARLGDRRALAPLAALLTDERPTLRGVACQVLGILGDGEAIEPLVRALEDRAPEVRAAACYALARLAQLIKSQNGTRVVPALRSGLFDSVRFVRQAARAALEALGFAVPALADSDQLAQFTAPSFSIQNDVALLPELRAILPVYGIEQHFSLVGPSRWSAPRPPSAEELIARLSDPQPRVRKSACEALERMRHANAVEPLIPLLGDGDAGVREAAASALKVLGHASLAEAVLGALSGQPDAREQLRQWIAGGDLRPVIPVVARLADEDREMREAASAVFAAAGGPAVEPLIPYLDDSRWAVRREVVRTLGRIGDPRAVKPLILRLADADPDVRQEAGRVLEAFGAGPLARAVLAVMSGAAGAADGLAALAVAGDLSVVRPFISLTEAAGVSREVVFQALRLVAGALAPLAHTMLCPACLARPVRFDAGSPWLHGAYWYACRQCREPGPMATGVQRVVAVLERGRREDPVVDNGVLFVNWLARGGVFDFDAVAIRDASDFDVERLCIAVGNDMDEYRKSRYPAMECRIAPECALSENAVRVLGSSFGKLVVKPETEESP